MHNIDCDTMASNGLIETEKFRYHHVFNDKVVVLPLDYRDLPENCFDDQQEMTHIDKEMPAFR